MLRSFIKPFFICSDIAVLYLCRWRFQWWNRSTGTQALFPEVGYRIYWWWNKRSVSGMRHLWTHGHEVQWIYCLPVPCLSSQWSCGVWSSILHTVKKHYCSNFFLFFRTGNPHEALIFSLFLSLFWWKNKIFLNLWYVLTWNLELIKKIASYDACHKKISFFVRISIKKGLKELINHNYLLEDIV